VCGLKPLPLRFARQNANCLAVAEHPEVELVAYPGLADHPDHQLAAGLLRGAGVMVTATLTADRTRARRTIGRLELIAHAASLGGVESLACLPRLASHSALPGAELDRVGISPNTIWLSLGIEDAEDLIADLEAARASCQNQGP